MDISKLDGLIIEVLENKQSSITSLKREIESSGTILPDAFQEKLEILWEEWDNGSLSIEKSSVILEAAERMNNCNSVFRKLLSSAIKSLLPPYLGHNSIMKALGSRDEAVTPANVAKRVRKLLELKNGVVVFLPASGRWGVAGTVDNINATMPLTSFGLLGGAGSVPLEVALREIVILKPATELNRLIGTTSPITAENFCAIVDKRSVAPVADDVKKLMAKYGCGRNMDAVAFEKYWSATSVAKVSAATGGDPATRRSCNGRSVKEMEVLLQNEAKNGNVPFSSEEVGDFKNFFERLKPDTAKREGKSLATVVSALVHRATAEQMREMLLVLLGKTTFWPADPCEAKIQEFEVWGELPAKSLEGLAQASSVIFDETYLAECTMRLPLKALNFICTQISDKTLSEVLGKRRNCGADLLLWVWKNRKKRSHELLPIVNLDNVVRILGSEDPPKAWGPARREMRSMLLDDWNFQSHLIDMLDGNTVAFGSVLQGALFLTSGERQSLMVKLARQSEDLRKYLEGGAGQRILNAGIGKNETPAIPKGTEPSYTSVKSHRALIKELDDIINIHTPENREALRTARAHGDFRENSEFDAAKERRNYLSRRRGELERELAVVQPIVMKSITVDDEAIIGSEVVLKFSDGQEEVYELLGAWDGDPERHFLSYRTRLGKAVLKHRTGDSFDAPDGRQCTLKQVRALPAEVIAELDD